MCSEIMLKSNDNSVEWEIYISLYAGFLFNVKDAGNLTYWAHS